MRLRRLGDSELEVSEISLGSWLTYSGGIEREHTEACTKAAFEAGINFFDTANVYGVGAAETAWGEILSGYERELLHPRDQGLLPDVGDGHRALARRRSRSRSTPRSSGCRPTTSTSTSATASISTSPIEETMEALTAVVDSGKARYIGFSEWTPEQIQAALDVAGRRQAGLLAAAVQRDLARPRGGGVPALRRATGSRRSSGRRSPRAC